MSLYQSLGVRASQNGKKIATGMIKPTSAAEVVATGLLKVDHCLIQFADPPNLTAMWASAKPHATAGSIEITTKRPTSSADATIIPATGSWVDMIWIAVGD